jgi:hypothetical protein
MDIIEDVFDLVEDNLGTGLAIGIGAAIVSPSIFTAIANFVKPVAKAVIKGGIIFYEKSKETYAELREVGEDVVAEAKAEAKEALAKKSESVVTTVKAAAEEIAEGESA